jgi:hypothetical protein
MRNRAALNLLSGDLSFRMGSDLSTRSLKSIHSFYFSVKRLFPPILSCSMLNVLMTTPTNRFMKKKQPTMTKTMKNIIHMMLASLSGTGR